MFYLTMYISNDILKYISSTDICINLVYQKQMNELQINQYIDCLSDQNGCNADWLYFKTFMNFSAGVYDVIAPAK